MKKGKHFVSVGKKHNWFTVFINSEVMNAKEPRAKFIDEEDAWDWAYRLSDLLTIGMEESLQ